MALSRQHERSRLMTLLILMLVATGTLQAATGSARAGESGATPTPASSPTPAPQPTGDPQAMITGTIRSDGEGVEGVQLVARTQAGDEVGTATTGPDGGWEITVPGPGTYEVELLPDTLPEGVSLRDPDRTTRTVRVLSAGGSTTAIFALGERAGSARQLSRLLQLVANGIRFGLIIAMTAIGLSLVFATTGLINFAHGELVTFGAIVAWFWSSQPGIDIHLIPAGLVAVALTAVLSGGLELGLFRPLRRRKVGLFQLLIITIGLSLVIRHVLLIFFGGSQRPYSDYTISRAITVGPISMPPRDLVIMGLSVLLLVGVGLMLLHTKIGTAMRAVSDNRDLAEASGIDVQQVILFVWGLGGALAATGGIFFGSIISVDWLMGFQLLLLMFAGVILGGLGTAFGAMVGSLVVGIVTEVSTFWFSSELKFMWGLFVLIIVLLVRPQGILGRRERVG